MRGLNLLLIDIYFTKFVLYFEQLLFYFGRPRQSHMRAGLKVIFGQDITTCHCPGRVVKVFIFEIALNCCIWRMPKWLLIFESC